MHGLEPDACCVHAGRVRVLRASCGRVGVAGWRRRIAPCFASCSFIFLSNTQKMMLCFLRHQILCFQTLFLCVRALRGSLTTLVWCLGEMLRNKRREYTI
jgi:hypothetical protein